MLKKILYIFVLFTAVVFGAENPAYQAKDYRNLLGKMKGFPDELLSMHFKLYEGYVKNTNELLSSIDALIKQKRERSLSFMALKRRVGWEYDGMRLHELYFENLGGTGAISKNSLLHKKIVRDFGSYSKWQEDFVATGLIRGIGWVILYEDPIQGRLLNVWINEHDVGHLAGGNPLLVMDVWEHAYITVYGLDRAGYINSFLQNVDWRVVESRHNPQ